MIWNPFKKQAPAPPIESLDDDGLIELACSMGFSLDREIFYDAEALIGWLCQHSRLMDRAADNKPMVRSETGIDAFASWADPEQIECLRTTENTSHWSLLGAGEQTYLYWDRGASEQPRIVELDHEERLGDVVMHDWRGARAALMGIWARWADAPGTVRRKCYCTILKHNQQV